MTHIKRINEMSSNVSNKIKSFVDCINVGNLCHPENFAAGLKEYFRKNKINYKTLKVLDKNISKVYQSCPGNISISSNGKFVELVTTKDEMYLFSFYRSYGPLSDRNTTITLHTPNKEKYTFLWIDPHGHISYIEDEGILKILKIK